MDQQGKSPLDLAYDNKHTIILEQDKLYTFTLYSEGKSKRFKSKKLTTKDFKFVMGLGQGAFGEVYLVEKDGKHYAMKQMKKRTYNGLLNFVLTEKEVQRKIRHWSIVKLRYAFQTFDRLFLVTDYCPGGDLRNLLNQKGRFSESDARLYLAEIIVSVG